MNIRGLLAGLSLLIFGWQVLNSNITFTSLENWNDSMEKSHLILLAGLPVISTLDFCGSLIQCRKFRLEAVGEKSWFEILVVCTIMQFGGTTLTGLLLGQTPSWIISNRAFPALTLAWWLTFFCPMDAYWKIVSKVPAILMPITLGAAISSGHAITSWGYDKAAFNKFHVNYDVINQSPLTCLLCGMLSGCGGGLVMDWLQLSPNTNTKPMHRPNMFSIVRPDILSTVASVPTKAFILSLWYLMMLNEHNYFPWGKVSNLRARAVIGCAQVGNMLLQTAFPHVDVFQQLVNVALTMFHISPSVNFDVDKLSNSFKKD